MRHVVVDVGVLFGWCSTFLLFRYVVICVSCVLHCFSIGVLPCCVILRLVYLCVVGIIVSMCACMSGWMCEQVQNYCCDVLFLSLFD